jgi:dimethylaniline monooxygenase (N-oxide forming)
MTASTSSLPTHTSTLIVGGGPSGIVSLKYCLEYGPKCDAGDEPVLVEMESEIGGTFKCVILRLILF